MGKSSEYISNEFREYSLYTISERALPSITDGLKPSGRRCLWKARDGKKRKVATLAGETMSLHPHSPPSGSIESLAFPYGNNIPLFKGDGTFGTRLNPKSAAAPRYTSVTVSQFSKEVLFADLSIIPLVDNYDRTEQEPKHFLPLVPIVLLNPQEGIAVGFSTTILPRTLKTIVTDQINYLKNGTVPRVKKPTLSPINQQAIGNDGENKWFFTGEYHRTNSTTITVTNLPYGINHETFRNHLIKLEEDGTILDFTDKSNDAYNIIIKFPRGQLESKSDEELLTLLKLRYTITENRNMIDFGHERVWNASYSDIITKFSDWRLGFYQKRYQRLAVLLEQEIQRYRDILLVVKTKATKLFSITQSKTELKAALKELGVVQTDYIVELGGYRFTEHEKKKVEKQLKEADNLLTEYQDLINSDELRKNVYIKELQTVQRKYG